MRSFVELKRILDQVNAALAEYDPVLKPKAAELLLEAALGTNGGRTGVSWTEEEASLGALLQRWRPSRASDRALLAGYYLQRIRGQEVLTSQAINAELKRYNLGVANITRAIETNLRTGRMEQLRKLGVTKQARKEYRLTPEGIRRVEERLGFGG